MHATQREVGARRHFGSPADTFRLDSVGLGEHPTAASARRARFSRELCLTETVHKFRAPRVVTTLAVVALLIGAAFGVL